MAAIEAPIAANGGGPARAAGAKSDTPWDGRLARTLARRNFLIPDSPAGFPAHTRTNLVGAWPPAGNYQTRPDLLAVTGAWPAFPVPAQPHQTTFRLRKTKAIDQPADICVLETDPLGIINRSSTMPYEASRLANRVVQAAAYAGQGPYGLWTTADPAYPLALGQAHKAGAYGNPNVKQYITVNIPTRAFALGMPVAGVAAGADTANYHLRQCWYSVLNAGLTAAVLPPGQAAAMTAAGMAATAPADLLPSTGAARVSVSITFPLLGNSHTGGGWTNDEAAEQACIALKEYFYPKAGSESTIGQVGGPITLRARRRSRYHNVFLTIVNGSESLLEQTVAGAPKNVFGLNMRSQELAWTKAWAKHLNCGMCGNGIDHA